MQEAQLAQCVANTPGGAFASKTQLQEHLVQRWNSQCSDKAVCIFKAIYRDEDPTWHFCAAAEGSKSWTTTPVHVLNSSGDHSCPLLN